MKRTIVVAMGCALFTFLPFGFLCAQEPPGIVGPTKDEYRRRPHIGVRTRTLNDELREQYQIHGSITSGAVIIEVHSGSDAEDKELKLGATIFEAGHEPIASDENLHAHIARAYSAGRRGILLRVFSPRGTPSCTTARIAAPQENAPVRAGESDKELCHGEGKPQRQRIAPCQRLIASGSLKGRELELPRELLLLLKRNEILGEQRERLGEQRERIAGLQAALMWRSGESFRDHLREKVCRPVMREVFTGQGDDSRALEATLATGCEDCLAIGLDHGFCGEELVTLKKIFKGDTRRVDRDAVDGVQTKYDRLFASCANKLGEQIGKNPPSRRSGDAISDVREDCKQQSAETAIEACTEVIRRNPTEASAYHKRAIAHHEQKDYDRAIADYSKLIEIGPRDPYYRHNSLDDGDGSQDAEYYSARGNAYWSKGDYDQTIADYSKAIEIEQAAHKQAGHYEERGYVYYAKGDNDRAIVDYNKAIELAPNQASAYHHRGYAYHLKKEYDRAIADYSKAIELDADYGFAYTGRATAYKEKDNNERAIADYAKAVEIHTNAIESDSENAAAYNGRAWAYLKSGKVAQALLDAEKSLELLPNDPWTLDTRAHIFEAMGRREDAITDFHRALAKNPNLQESRAGLKRLGVAP